MNNPDLEVLFRAVQDARHIISQPVARLTEEG